MPIEPQFRFKKFQREDYARAALLKGLILAHDTGLGKSLAGLTWPLLKVGFDKAKGCVPLKPVLLVVPEHLHQQWAEEAWSRMHVRLFKLDCQDTFNKLTRGGVLSLEPGWYITSYTQLASNKVGELFDLDQPMTPELLKQAMAFYRVAKADVQAFRSESMTALHQKAMYLCQQVKARWSEGIGEVVGGIRCVYSPSLAELCKDAFECVVIDEATHIKGDYTLLGRGVRLMNPKYRLVLTATPIKNRLPDLFWLAWWASGGKEEAHPRWPYSSEPGEKEKFAQEFMVCERNLSKERAQNNGRPLPSRMRGGRWRRGKPTAEVCNIHRLWKLIAPVILRRRKRDIGEDLVEKIRQPIRVPMGKRQAEVYSYHLSARYLDKNGKDAVGAKLQALRSAAAAPHSDLLRPVSDPEDTDHRSHFDYIPKVAATLTVIEQVVRRGEQVVVFSAFHEPLDTLSRRLSAAGVPHDILDGRLTQAERGRLAGEFKKGRPKAKPVLLAGVNAMAEGHSWHLANNAILVAFDWAYNLFEQAINRIHRLPSPKPVNVYPIICAGTIDRKLESLIEEKGNAAELVLDGKLLGENVEEVNLAELLQVAFDEFDQTATIAEEELEQQWPALCARLADAWTKTRFVGLVNGGIRRLRPEPLFVPYGLSVQVPLIRLSPGRSAGDSRWLGEILRRPADRILAVTS